LLNCIEFRIKSSPLDEEELGQLGPVPAGHRVTNRLREKADFGPEGAGGLLVEYLDSFHCPLEKEPATPSGHQLELLELPSKNAHLALVRAER